MRIRRIVKSWAQQRLEAYLALVELDAGIHFERGLVVWAMARRGHMREKRGEIRREKGGERECESLSE